MPTTKQRKGKHRTEWIISTRFTRKIKLMQFDLRRIYHRCFSKNSRLPIWRIAVLVQAAQLNSALPNFNKCPKGIVNNCVSFFFLFVSVFFFLLPRKQKKKENRKYRVNKIKIICLKDGVNKKTNIN